MAGLSEAETKVHCCGLKNLIVVRVNAILQTLTLPLIVALRDFFPAEIKCFCTRLLQERYS